MLNLGCINKNNVIFSEGEEVSIILGGSVVMYSHTQNVAPSRFLARYEEGDVLGSYLDSGASKLQENWGVTR